MGEIVPRPRFSSGDNAEKCHAIETRSVGRRQAILNFC